MIETVFEGNACIDCTMVIANADTSGIADLDSWAAGVLAQNISNDYGMAIMDCSEDCEGSYSTSPCDYCGNRDHGERHPFVVLGQRPTVRYYRRFTDSETTVETFDTMAEAHNRAKHLVVDLLTTPVQITNHQGQDIDVSHNTYR